MATLALNDVYEVKFFCTLNNQLGINLRHYLCTIVTGVAATDQDFADNLSTFMGPLYKPLLTNSAQYYGLGVRRIKPLPATIPAFSALARGAGTAGLNPLPGQASGVVTLNTPFSGRANRGRAYIPFPCTNDADPLTGFCTAAYALRLSLAGVGLIFPRIVTASVGIGTATMEPVLYHRQLTTVTTLTAQRGNQKWGTQRRRGMYGRPNLLPF